jgi:sarcosine oxidase subunit delta
VSFLLQCPHCGERPSPEFAYGGTVGDGPPAATLDALSEELYFSDNTAGEQLERWFHRFGCERWFVARRDTTTNAVAGTWPGVHPPAGEQP